MTDFWNYNLHPITMYKKEQEKQTDNYKGRIPLGIYEFNPELHIYSSDAMKITGERAKNLKKKITNAGFEVFVHKNKTVYLIKSLEQFKQIKL